MVNFPVINTLDDVLPHVEDWNEITVNDKGSYVVVGYQMMNPEMFSLKDDPIGGMIRHECRGLIFDKKTGTIMSRPFHKFFNVNEREESMAENIDLSRDHVVMEKMDGSMVRPMVNDDRSITLATKAGITDIGEDAAKLLTGEQKQWLLTMMCLGYTPIMEYVSPDNRIVIQYDKSNLVLLAIRENRTGKYVGPRGWRGYIPFDIVNTYGSVGCSLSDYVSKARLDTGREGDILAFSNGEYYKIKNDWYVEIHKAKEDILFDRHIVRLFIEGTIDDILPNLPKVDVDRCYDVYAEFLLRKKVFTEKVLELTNHVVESGMSKKEFAVDMSKSIDKIVAGMIFKVMDKDNDLEQIVIDLVDTYTQSLLATNTKYDLMMKKLKEFEWRKE